MALVNIDKARKGGATNALDAIRSIAHLANTCGFNQSHSMRHLHECRASLEVFRGGNKEAMASVAWNAEHVLNHLKETIEHSQKLTGHIDKHQDMMLHLVPLNIQADFTGVARKLTESLKKAQSNIEASFKVMDRAQTNEGAYIRLHDLLKDAHQTLEQVNDLLHELSKIIISHDDIYDEYCRLIAHYKLPEKPLPTDIKAYLDETLTLLD